MNMNMVFSILPELLILCKDEGEETGAYSSAMSITIVWAVIDYRDGNEEEVIAVNSSPCSAMSMSLFLGLFALLSFLRRSEEEEAFTTNSLSFL